MATETDLTKVNVFSSKEQYDNNKSSLASTELAIVPLPDLVQYVDGSNASIDCHELRAVATGKRIGIQTGSYTRDGGTKTITFAVPFSSSGGYNFYVKYDGDKYQGPPYITYQEEYRQGTFIKLKTTNANGKKAYWFAIGYLQRP